MSDVANKFNYTKYVRELSKKAMKEISKDTDNKFEEEHVHGQYSL